MKKCGLIYHCMGDKTRLGINGSKKSSLENTCKNDTQPWSLKFADKNVDGQVNTIHAATLDTLTTDRDGKFGQNLSHIGDDKLNNSGTLKNRETKYI